MESQQLHQNPHSLQDDDISYEKLSSKLEEAEVQELFHM